MSSAKLYGEGKKTKFQNMLAKKFVDDTAFPETDRVMCAENRNDVRSRQTSRTHKTYRCMYVCGEYVYIYKHYIHIESVK